jgi:hypothetical protein
MDAIQCLRTTQALPKHVREFQESVTASWKSEAIFLETFEDALGSEVPKSWRNRWEIGAHGMKAERLDDGASSVKRAIAVSFMAREANERH